MSVTVGYDLGFWNLVISGFIWKGTLLLGRSHDCSKVLVFVVSGEPMLVQAGSLYSFSTRRLTT